MMTGAEIIAKVKSLNLSQDSYVVFGAAPLAVAGLREANDIDMFVTQEVIELKKKEGWKFVDKGGKNTPLCNDCFEMHTNWDFDHGYNPSFAELQATANIIDGIPFAALAEVRKWKVSYNRPKDLVDIALVDAYLSSHQTDR